MRIALVSALYPPEFLGGIERVVQAQGRALHALGHDVRIVCGSRAPYAGLDVVRDLVDGVPVARIPRFVHERRADALAEPRVAELARREVGDAEIVHVHHVWTLACDLVRTIALDRPVSLTLHDHFASCPRFFRASPVEGLLCPPGDADPRMRTSTCARCLEPDADGRPHAVLGRWLESRLDALQREIAAASLVIAPSTTHRLALEDTLRIDAGRVRVLRHGLCAEPGEIHEPRRVFDGGRPLSVLHFGHRAEVKGVLDLVRALASLPSGSVELLLAGVELEPGFDARLRAAAGRLPIEILGRYEPAQLAALAVEADLAAFPSRASESYALVVEEALALGLSAWVSDRGALPEALCVNANGGLPGRILPAGDPEAWSRAFREALAFPMMLALERAAIPSQLRRAHDAARELVTEYENLLATAPRP